MKNQVLSVKQMNYLKDTMMYWARTSNNYSGKVPYTNGDVAKNVSSDSYDIIPAYSLQDIIELLPKEIKIGKELYKLNICPLREHWCISYDGVIDSIMVKRNKSILEAAYRMFVWCVKNGYLNKDITDKICGNCDAFCECGLGNNGAKHDDPACEYFDDTTLKQFGK
ncbi:hypothetical protein [Coprobacter sp.]|uniref:hypothetical protein n=1 Tax=Coprobacter sp. TaxID=1941478 RepID=UPI003AB148BB